MSPCPHMRQRDFTSCEQHIDNGSWSLVFWQMSCPQSPFRFFIRSVSNHINAFLSIRQVSTTSGCQQSKSVLALNAKRRVCNVSLLSKGLLLDTPYSVETQAVLESALPALRSCSSFSYLPPQESSSCHSQKYM